jgi:hypothetical protein
VGVDAPSDRVIVHEEIRSMRMISRKFISKSGASVAKTFGFILVMGGLSVVAAARGNNPEMDPGLATSAMALLGGGLLLIAGRRPRK